MEQSKPKSISFAQSASKPSTAVMGRQRKGGFGRLLKLGRTATKTDGGDDTSSVCTSATAETQQTMLQSGLKIATGSSMTSLSSHDEDNNKNKKSSPHSRKPRVHWDLSKNASAPSPSDYGDPELWWNNDDLKSRELLDDNTMKTNAKAKAYLHHCMQIRLTKCMSFTDAISSSSPNQQRVGASTTKLQRVFVQDLQPGYTQGFRGLESVSGRSIRILARMRGVAAESTVQGVLLAQQECQKSMPATELATHLAKVAARQSLLDRCWARLLAIGDELDVDLPRK